MIARYGGRCEDGDQIRPGDEIEQGKTGWRHRVHETPVKVVRPPERPAVEAGFYLHEGQVVRAQPSQSTGNLYAMLLVIDEGAKTGRFEYAPGLMRRLSASEQLTTEQAAALGHQYGVCVICGATLTEAKSVARGIGPVCVKKLGAPRATEGAWA